MAEILDLSFHLFISAICALNEVYMVMADIYLSSLEYVNVWPVQYSNIVLSLIGERDKVRAHGNLYLYLNGVETS